MRTRTGFIGRVRGRCSSALFALAVPLGLEAEGALHSGAADLGLRVQRVAQGRHQRDDEREPGTPSATPRRWGWSSSTINGTVVALGDYTALAATTLTWSPSSPLTKNVSVPVAGDTLKESNETCSVVLSVPVNAVIGDTVGTATVLDEEGPFHISVKDASVTEGNSGSKAMTFTLALSARPAQRAERHGEGGDRGRHRHRSNRLHRCLFDQDLRSRGLERSGHGHDQGRHRERSPTRPSSSRCQRDQANADVVDADATSTIVNNDGAAGAAVKRSVYDSDGSVVEGNTGTTTGHLHVLVVVSTAHRPDHQDQRRDC